MFSPMLLRRHVRLLTLVLAAMNFVAPAVVSVADGAFAMAVRDSAMHVEANGGNECTPPHSTDCTVCRYLSGNEASAPAADHADIPTQPVTTFALETESVRAPACEFARSRAPPAV